MKNLEQERIGIAIPKGKQKDDVLGFMKAVGIEFKITNPRSYQVEVANMPVDFILVSAGDVPENIQDPDFDNIKAGITGSDILWNAGYDRHNAGDLLPVNLFLPNPRQSRLYIGITREFALLTREVQERDPVLSDLIGYKMGTPYPRIAQEILAERGITGITIKERKTTENTQYMTTKIVFPGSLDVIEEGTTAEANAIEALEIFYNVSLQMVKAVEKLSRRDADILDDIREKITVAVERKRVV